MHKLLTLLHVPKYVLANETKWWLHIALYGCETDSRLHIPHTNKNLFSFWKLGANATKNTAFLADNAKKV